MDPDSYTLCGPSLWPDCSPQHTGPEPAFVEWPLQEYAYSPGKPALPCLPELLENPILACTLGPIMKSTLRGAASSVTGL